MKVRLQPQGSTPGIDLTHHAGNLSERDTEKHTERLG